MTARADHKATAAIRHNASNPHLDQHDETLLLGCCGDRCLRWLLSTFHLIDTAFGILLLIYGVLISLSHKSGTNGLKIYCIGLGSGMIISAAIGALALHVSVVERSALLLGGSTAVIISLVELISGFRIEFNQIHWIAYLKEYESELYLNDAIIKLLEKARHFMFSIAILLSVAEFFRFYIMCRVRRDLIESDNFRDNHLKRPLLWRDTACEEFSDLSVEFFPVDEDTFQYDPLWWAKSATTEDGADLSWATEDV